MKYLLRQYYPMLCFFLAIQSNVIAQSKPVYFDRFYTGVGLSDNMTEHVIEDSYGFLWITTHNGLNRFDGNTFKVYRHDNTDSTSLPHNNLYGIFEDSRGRLWIGTSAGLALYNRKKDNFKRFNIFKHQRLENDVNLVWTIKEDNNGTVWFCTVNGICSFNEKEQAFSWELSLQHKLDSAVVLDFLFDHDDNIWFGTEKKGVLRIDAKTRALKQYGFNEGKNSISSNNIKCLIEDKYHRIWVGTTDSGICVIDIKKDEIKRFGKKEGLITPFITYLYESKNGILWASCINGGLMYFNPVENKFVHFNIKSSDKNEVGLKSITSVYEDSNGIFWITGRLSGLLCLNPHKNRFISYKCIPDGSGLNNPVVTSFYEGKDGRIWIGTDGGGVNLFDPVLKKFIYIDHTNGLSTNAVLDLKCVVEGKLWVATWGGGLNEIDMKTLKTRRIFNNEQVTDQYIAPNIKCIYDDDTLVWFGTHGYGLHILDKKRGRIIKDENNKVFNFSLVGPKWCENIMKDSKKRYWFSSSYGLYMLSAGSSRIFLYDGKPGCLNGLSIFHCIEDAHQNIWVVSDAGLNKFDEHTGRFVNINKKTNNLPERLVSLVSDYSGNLWMGSNVGLVKYDTRSNLVKIYTESEGVQGEIFFENSVMRTSKGELFFGGLNGFNRNNPQATRIVQKYPRVYITNINHYNPNARSDDELFVNKTIFDSDTVYIDQSQSIFTIEYSGVYLLSPRDLIYKYKLEGFNTSWISSTERKATYTNLDPGTYTFYVNSLTRDGAWAVEADSITIVVLPPWWNTIYFKSCVVVSVILLLFGLYRYRVNKMKKTNQLLEVKVQERTRELDIKNKEIVEQGEKIKDQMEILEMQNKELIDLNYTKDKFLSIISHDLKNPMATVIGFSELLIVNLEKFQTEKIRSYLKLIHDSSCNIHELLKNLLDWSRSQTGHITYDPQPLKLTLLVSEVKYFVEEMAVNKQIEIKIESPDVVTVMADKNMTEAVIRNILNNSIKFTRPNGLITIKIAVAEQRAHISITDNGIGMDTIKISKLFQLGVKSNTKGTNNETGTGLGLIICREFLRYHGSTLSVKSIPGEGSCFSFSLPLV